MMSLVQGHFFQLPFHIHTIVLLWKAPLVLLQTALTCSKELQILLDNIIRLLAGIV